MGFVKFELVPVYIYVTKFVSFVVPYRETCNFDVLFVSLPKVNQLHTLLRKVAIVANLYVLSVCTQALLTWYACYLEPRVSTQQQ